MDQKWKLAKHNFSNIVLTLFFQPKNDIKIRIFNMVVNIPTANRERAVFKIHTCPWALKLKYIYIFRSFWSLDCLKWNKPCFNTKWKPLLRPELSFFKTLLVIFIIFRSSMSTMFFSIQLEIYDKFFKRMVIKYKISIHKVC